MHREQEQKKASLEAESASRETSRTDDTNATIPHPLDPGVSALSVATRNDPHPPAHPAPHPLSKNEAASVTWASVVSSGSHTGNKCKIRTAADWYSDGCYFSNPTSPTVESLGTHSRVVATTSCEVSCPVNGEDFVVYSQSGGLCSSCVWSVVRVAGRYLCVCVLLLVISLSQAGCVCVCVCVCVCDLTVDGRKNTPVPSREHSLPLFVVTVLALTLLLCRFHLVRSDRDHASNHR